MKLIIWACLTLAAWPSVISLYYTVKKEVFHPPGDRHLRNNSYFGYSITYDALNKKLVISAPRENRFGEVYNCDIQNRACTPINVPKKKDWSDANYTHDYWFGATVKAGPDFVMMCAPRYTEHGQFKHVANGKCYSYTNGAVNERKSIEEGDRVDDLPEGYHTQDTMDSFGWSIDVACDKSIIVGGPGMYHGRAMIYEGPQADKTPKVIKGRNIKAEFNFGYAVASGKFINDSLSYAVGSTYGTTGHGEVIFYNGLSFQQKLETEEVTRARTVGSMFGAVLCAANLIGKRTDFLVRTDLLVGAPTYAKKNTYNLGAVYVYLALKDGEAPEYKRRIVGKDSGSMFGSAIINVGDLNGDEKHEVAIGAPFEKEGHGVVYLYSGASLLSDLAERDLKCLQEIKPESSYSESFGMSLTSASDYDQNGCNALAIGSPYEDTVVILRCMAAVDVKTSVKFPDLQGRISSNKTDFEFEICLIVTYPSKPENIIVHLSTMVTMDHEYAKLANGTFSFKTSLHDKKPAYCKDVSFILPLEGNYETKISYTISTKLLDDPATLPDYKSSHVILSDRSDLKIQGSLGVADCAGAICVPYLNLTTYISFHHDDDPYIIGSSTRAEPEVMNITVQNYGDVAYEPCVRVHIYGGYVLATPTGCVHEDSTDGNWIKCEPPKSIRKNTEWTTGRILLEVMRSTNLDMNKSIIISTNLYNNCEGVVTQNYLTTTYVQADPSGIVAKGETGISAIVNMTQEDIKTNGKRMQHDYTISNKGPTNWEGLQIEVTLQNEPYIKYNDTPVTLYSESTSKYTPCPAAQRNKTSTIYACEVESLKKNVESPKILIPMYIEPGTLDGILVKDKNVTIVSSVKLLLIDGHYKVESFHGLQLNLYCHLWDHGACNSAEISGATITEDIPVSTTLTLVEVPVPIKTIIIAVVVGICILIIISAILYSVGFLRRKKREELEELKRSVKRQTILWRSTLPSQAPQAEDQMQILEEMKKEDEHCDQARLSQNIIKYRL